MVKPSQIFKNDGDKTQHTVVSLLEGFVNMETAPFSLYDASGARKYLNAAERAAFLDAAQKMEPRICAFCEVLALTGCRVSEALELCRERVDLAQASLIFRTLKRRAEHFRSVPVPRQLIDRLLALPPGVGQGRTPRARFFPECRQTYWEYVKLVMDAAGIKGPQACPKGLRHGFGMRAVERGVPEGLLQRWLGHARRETTDVYLQAVGPEERAFAERTW
ncbi:MAG: site-specific integrase [Hyphomicrobiales bacterium]|nr:site-specific integrase [Hyphomicrobiales bacterium]